MSSIVAVVTASLDGSGGGRVARPCMARPILGGVRVDHTVADGSRSQKHWPSLGRIIAARPTVPPAPHGDSHRKNRSRPEPLWAASHALSSRSKRKPDTSESGAWPCCLRRTVPGRLNHVFLPVQSRKPRPSSIACMWLIRGMSLTTSSPGFQREVRCAARSMKWPSIALTRLLSPKTQTKRNCNGICPLGRPGRRLAAS